MQTHLDSFFQNIIDNRFDKRWQPHFFASENVAEWCQTILGIAVTADPYIEPNTVEMRTETGTLCAKLNGIRSPEQS